MQRDPLASVVKEKQTLFPHKVKSSKQNEIKIDILWSSVNRISKELASDRKVPPSSLPHLSLLSLRSTAMQYMLQTVFQRFEL
jgi:hypothetical protein